MSGWVVTASQASAPACSARPAAISGRLPMRSERIPATGATKIGIAVQGKVRMPASAANSPAQPGRTGRAGRSLQRRRRTSQRHAVRGRKPRLRKKRVGSIGVLVRDSHRTKPARSTAPAASEPTTVVLVQPSDWAARSRTPRPQTGAASATPEGRASRWAHGSRAAPIRPRAPGPDRSAVEPEDPLPGEPLDHRTPTTGPSATPRPETPDQMPSASPRLSAAKASLRSVRDSGVIAAAPSPCSARAAISASVREQAPPRPRRR